MPAPGVLRILLVEDSLPVRRRIRSLIEEFLPAAILGEAGTVADALAYFRAQPLDAVVLDLNLADGDGCDVLCEIKRTRPTCVVLVLTNHDLPGMRELCLQEGADHYFIKSREFERVPEVPATLGGSPGASATAA